MSFDRDLDRSFDRPLSDAFEEWARDAAPDDLVARSLVRVDATRQRPGWLTRDRWRPGREARRGWRPLTIAPAAAAVVVAIAVVAIGPGLFRFGPPGSSQPPATSVGTIPSATATAAASGVLASMAPSASAVAHLGGGEIIVLAAEPVDGRLSISALDVRTKSLRPLGSVPGPRGNPLTGRYGLTASNDHQTVAVMRVEGDPPDVVVIHEPPRLVRCCDVANASGWVLSPDGRQAVGLIRGERSITGIEGTVGVELGVVVVDIATGASRQLPVTGDADVFSPAWSPDGRAVVVVSCRPCNYAQRKTDRPTTPQHTHLLILPLDGSASTELVDDTTGTFGAPAWSPDGSTIAIAGTTCPKGAPPSFCFGGVSALSLVDVTTGTRTSVAETSDWGGGPVWSPDGSRLAFADGSAVVTISPTGRDRQVVAKGDTPSWSPDGQWLLYALRDDQGKLVTRSVAPAMGGTPIAIGAWAQAVW